MRDRRIEEQPVTAGSIYIAFRGRPVDQIGFYVKGQTCIAGPYPDMLKAEKARKEIRAQGFGTQPKELLEYNN